MKNDYEYFDESPNTEMMSIIQSIDIEINSLKRIKKNITLFAFSENMKGKLIFLEFNRLILEIERMGREIETLEEKKRNYVRISNLSL